MRRRYKKNRSKHGAGYMGPIKEVLRPGKLESKEKRLSISKYINNYETKTLGGSTIYEVCLNADSLNNYTKQLAKHRDSYWLRGLCRVNGFSRL